MSWAAPADRDRGQGALWGLALGDALPRRWVERVHDARPPDDALATRFHARALIELVP